MHSVLCRQQDVARQFNVRLSTFSRPLSRFRVTRQVSTRQRYRRQLKTTVYCYKVEAQQLHVCNQSYQ
jgi:hypothetical protein